MYQTKHVSFADIPGVGFEGMDGSYSAIRSSNCNDQRRQQTLLPDINRQCYTGVRVCDHLSIHDKKAEEPGSTALGRICPEYDDFIRTDCVRIRRNRSGEVLQQFDLIFHDLQSSTFQNDFFNYQK